MKRTHYIQQPNWAAPPVDEPPTYPAGMSATYWTPEYVRVPSGYLPLIDIPIEEDVTEEYLSVGELRKVIGALPDEAPVILADQEYGGLYDAREVSVREGKVHLS